MGRSTIVARRVGTARAAVGVVTAVLLAVATVGVAHGQQRELLGSMPADGEVVDAAPSFVRAVFGAPVEPVDPALVVRGPDGEQVDLGDGGAGPSSAVVEASLPDALPPGSYEATWSVRFEGDDEVRSGSWRFEVAAAPDRSGLGLRGWLVALAAALVATAGAALWVSRREDARS